MIKSKPIINARHLEGQVLAQVDGYVELCNVCFSYPSRPDLVIFNNFNLEIPSGKSMALVGGSGSGKSTVISLIERFYDPISGDYLCTSKAMFIPSDIICLCIYYYSDALQEWY